jgi:hypothetical protein
LSRFDGLEGAVVSFEEGALAVGFIEERQAIALGTEAGVALDKLQFGDLEVLGDGSDFLLRDFDKTGPAAASGAALAGVPDIGRHGV